MQSIKTQSLIDKRVFYLESFHHFGDWKRFKNGLAELKWKSGIRVYFFKVDDGSIFLIHGGHKNAQKKDIKKAQGFFKKYAEI